MSTPYRTGWIPVREVSGPSDLVTKAFLYYAALLIPRTLFQKRTVETVRTAYNLDRQKMVDDLEGIDWDSYVFFSKDRKDFTLIDGQVRFSEWRAPRELLLNELKDAVSSVARPGATVVEFGSGDGRNLFYLKKCFPDMKFVGFELSDISVGLSQAASTKFKVADVSFYCADVTRTLPIDLSQENVICCFSSFALEMMPKIFQGAVDQMLSLSSDLVVFFEPVDELWSHDLRGWASKLRVLNLHRLRGLYRYVQEVARKGEWTIERAQRSGIAINPFNEMVQIRLKRKK